MPHEVVVEEALALGEAALEDVLVFFGHLLLHVHLQAAQEEGAQHLRRGQGAWFWGKKPGFEGFRGKKGAPGEMGEKGEARGVGCGAGGQDTKMGLGSPKKGFSHPKKGWLNPKRVG